MPWLTDTWETCLIFKRKEEEWMEGRGRGEVGRRDWGEAGERREDQAGKIN